MSGIAQPTSSAIAFQVVAALERYEQHSAELVENMHEPSLHRLTRNEIAEIQRHSTAVPAMSAPALALLMAHRKLVASLCDRPDVPGTAMRWAVSPQLDEVGTCVATLRSSCLRHLVRDGS